MSSVDWTYTPPPPTEPSKSYDHPAAATPLPPVDDDPKPSTDLSRRDSRGEHSQQIRYCYFISAASASNGPARNPSARKTIYLAPHVQEPMHTSPNCSQPRPARHSRDSAPVAITTSGAGAFVFGPHPPQIQLGFLEDEPLPPPASVPLGESAAAAADKIIATDAVQVERKDSGYGSVSRSSSLAAFGRGIRKVFWRTSSKGTVESLIVTEPPVLDCDIPKDTLDHTGWADDLTYQLTLAATDSGVITAWLSEDDDDAASSSSESLEDLIEEIVFTVPHGAFPGAITTIKASVPSRSASTESLVIPAQILEFLREAESSTDSALYPTPSETSANSSQSGPAAGRTLRPVLSMEILNKPQPPLPSSVASIDKPMPLLPTNRRRSTEGPSSLSSLSSLARKFAGKGPAVGPHARPSVKHYFEESMSGATLSSPDISLTMDSSRSPSESSSGRSRRCRRGSSPSMNRSSIDGFESGPQPLVMSPEEELEGSSYMTSHKSSKLSSRFFRSLTGASAAEVKAALRENEERPLSEVLLSHSNLTPQEISAEIALAARSTSLRSPPSKRVAGHLTEQAARDDETGQLQHRKLSFTSSFECLVLAPPEPLFYNRGGVAASVSSLGDGSSRGSLDLPSSVAESSADESDGLSRMARHTQEQLDRYTTDLRGLQALLYQVDPSSSSTRSRPISPAPHSANTSTHSLSPSTASVPSIPPSPSHGSRTESKPKSAATSATAPKLLHSKKEDYMSHRMSGLSPKLHPVHAKTKPRSKSRLSMAYGGGELEVVKPAKFDTPEAIARNKEIRKFISQEIYTTEVNYLQYLRTIQEVFVDPLYRSMETEKPFIPRANALFHLLTHVSALMAVSVQLVQRLEACVKDDVWSDESSLIGTIFLEAKEPLTIFLRYGQAYGKGMKALRTLMKSKRATISFASPAHSISSVTGPAGGNSLTVSSQDQDDCAGEPRLDKRRSLPSIFVLNSAGVSSGHGHSTSVGATSGPGHLLGVDLSMSNGHTSQVSSRYSMSNISNKSSSIRSTHSGHESMTTVTKSRVGSGSSSAYAQFLRNCAGNKETTGRFSLADLLILPIQRVTRYCLLLKDLKRHTDTGHEDYVGLVHALEQVHTLALATNNAQPASMRM